MKRAYHGDWMDALPSRFINEIPDESVKRMKSTQMNLKISNLTRIIIEFNDEYRSPGWNRFKKNKMLKWKK